MLVTGTNGKTTTTKMLVAGLRGSGATVVTNTTGSNMTRGLIAALIEDMTYFGTIKPTDWFVFEMDEAYAPIFTQGLSPKVVVGLNVLRDQLDRYGEIDKTARMIKDAAVKSETFVYNELDPLLCGVAAELRKQNIQPSSFGVAPKLVKNVENEQTMHGQRVSVGSEIAQTEATSVEEKPDSQIVTLRSHHKDLAVNIPLKGFHNVLNLAAVVATLEILQPGAINQSLQAIEKMPVPFGRGERLHIKDKAITVALVKNPSGFATNLETFVRNSNAEAVVFVVNDRLADGRDVSWLWDVNFEDVIPKSAAVLTSGIRAYDMAVRLKQDGVEVNTLTSISKTIQLLMKSDYKNVVIIPTYTSLFEVRTTLSKYGKVPKIW